jgi:chorismate mutase
MPVRDIADEFHEAYCEATGLKVKYTFSFYSDWFLFAKEFTQDDIKTVVNYLRKLYKDKPEILMACLRITKLIRERDTFAQYLAEAKAEARKPRMTERDRVMEATGRAKEPPDNTRSAGQVLDQSSDKALEILSKFKEEQGMK